MYLILIKLHKAVLMEVVNKKQAIYDIGINLMIIIIIIKLLKFSIIISILKHN